MPPRIFPDRVLTQAERNQRWREKNAHRLPGIWKKSREKHKDRRREDCRRWQRNNPHTMWIKAKKRAQELGLPFDITYDDVVIPEVCPILKVPFSKQRDFLPSLDRLIPSKGYAKDNVWVISVKANRWKNEMTLDDLRNLISAIEKRLCQ